MSMISFDERNYEATVEELLNIRNRFFSLAGEAESIYSRICGSFLVSEEACGDLKKSCDELRELYERLELLCRAASSVPMQYRAAQRLSLQVSENAELSVDGEREIRKILLTEIKKEISQIRFSEKKYGE